MSREKNQQRHVQLINLLNKFDQYDKSLKVIETERTSDDVQFIDINDINKSVVVLTDVLNLSGGSMSDVNLYELLQVYFRIPEYREKINDILNQAKYSD